MMRSDPLSTQLEKQGSARRHPYRLHQRQRPPFRRRNESPNLLDSNGPLRGGKRDLYEGGIRIPFITSWPAAIKPGQTSDHPSAFWDFLPTVCELTGSPVPENIQGISYAPTLTRQWRTEKTRLPLLGIPRTERSPRHPAGRLEARPIQPLSTRENAPPNSTISPTTSSEGNRSLRQESGKTEELLALIETARTPANSSPSPRSTNNECDDGEPCFQPPAENPILIRQ